MISALRICWFVACVALLVWANAGCERVTLNPTLRNECAFLWGEVALALLNFPLSVAWWLLLSAVGAALSSIGIEIGLTSALNLAASAGFIAVGYFQWFVLLPFIMRQRKSRPPEARHAE